VLADLRRGDLPGSVWRDLQDTYAFYLSDEDRARLRSMNRVGRWFNTLKWVLGGLIRKLAPGRRLILLLAPLLFVHAMIVRNPLEIVVAFLLPVFVLLFELRDKLLARDELEVGRAVQLALLPDRNPELEGWDIWLFTRPANDVGGDLLDYLPFEGGDLGLALGDVAGKGLGAALLMSKLQATLRAWATDVPSLADLGARTNRILCRDGLPNRFATLTFLRIPPNAGRVRLLNAGHLPPIVVRG
jgi:sigma-B regulation protein RsbU (phosphoserine phosphatase)